MYKYPDTVDTDLKAKLPTINVFEEEDKNFFTPDYYKNIISSDPQLGPTLHKVFLDYLTPKKDGEEDTEKLEKYRRVISTYWAFLKSIAKNITNLTMEQKVLFRFAALLPNALGSELKTLISKTIWDNNYNEPFIYFDEWIYGVNDSKLQKLMVDDPIINVKDDDMKKVLINKKEKLFANVEFLKSGLKRNEKIRMDAIEKLKDMFEFLFLNDPSYNLYDIDEFGIKSAYSDLILRPLNSANNYIEDLIKSNRSIANDLKTIEESKQQLVDTQMKIQNLGQDLDSSIAVDEVSSVMNANKLTIGPRGNHFPILLKNNVSLGPDSFGTRERVIKIVKEIEDIQPRIFHKNYRGDILRIVPYFILIPSYGAAGTCWESIDIYNRASGRGKIIIPMYAKDLRKAIILGIGDFIWELSKEQASYRWMETGITGQYYEYYSKFIKKGNIKSFFVEDYLLWIEKESKGIQKLEKPVRGVMWRNSAFTRELKEELAKKSFVYKDLFDKDKNIEMSDGY